jgi:hypothetical protein
VPGNWATSPRWLWAFWLADDRHLIVRRPEGIAYVDTETGERHMAIAMGGLMAGRVVGAWRDTRWLMCTESASEGDIWMATFRNGVANR